MGYLILAKGKPRCDFLPPKHTTHGKGLRRKTEPFAVSGKRSVGEGFAPAGATYFLLVQKVRKDTFKEGTLSTGFPP